MTAGGVDIIEQGPRGPRRAGIALLVALAAGPFVVILASRDTSRPAPEPPKPPTPVREVVTVAGRGSVAWRGGSVRCR
ncbi:hypothetical protein AB0K16_49430 [Nonomuraea jabiensis]|uniref:hypothetical protein n=1 Tax=Nonomuraea jabiensis TaxID=882448 RepID=UPI00343B4CCD